MATYAQKEAGTAILLPSGSEGSFTERTLPFPGRLNKANRFLSEGGTLIRGVDRSYCSDKWAMKGAAYVRMVHARRPPADMRRFYLRDVAGDGAAQDRLYDRRN